MAVTKLIDLSPAQQYNLLLAVQHPSMGYAQEKVYIREDGEFHFYEGNKLTIEKPLDKNDPKEAQQILSGKKTKKVTLDGTYINSKRMVFALSFDAVLQERLPIYERYLSQLLKERAGITTPEARQEISNRIEVLRDDIAGLKEATIPEAQPDPEETSDQRKADLKAIGIEADVNGNYVSGAVTYGPELLTCPIKDFKKALTALKKATK